MPHRIFAAPDRLALQDDTIAAVQADPQPFLDRYAADPRSLGGRYISADLVKETFPEYSQSREGRARYGQPLAGPANALAEAQFSRALQDNSDPERDRVLFVTGLSGVGKSTAVVAGFQREGLPDDTRAIFEGDLGTPEQALATMQRALDAGTRPEITAVYTPPEIVVQNTISRFERDGQTASTKTMGVSQSRLIDSLNAIHSRFGDQVGLTVIDRSAGMMRQQTLKGWEHLPVLEKDGTSEQIQRRVDEALDQHQQFGTLSVSAFRQASGLTTADRPERIYERADRGRGTETETDARGLHPGDGAGTGRVPGSATGTTHTVAGATSGMAHGLSAGREGSADLSGGRVGTGVGTGFESSGIVPMREGALIFWSYEVGETTYKYAAGRLSVPGNAMQVPGEVVGPRNLHAQSAVSRGTGYDAGHLIGHQFGGPENNENLSLQSPTMNQGGGSYYIFETDLAQRVAADHTIAVNICEVTKKGDPAFSQRHFNVVDTAPDGTVKQEVRQFGNPETEQARRQRIAAQQTGAGITAAAVPARTPDKPIQQLAEEALVRRAGYRSDIRAAGRELGRNDEARGEVIAVNGSHVALATGANSYAVVNRSLLEQRSPEFPPDSRTPAQVAHDANARRNDGRGTAPGAPNTFDENKIALGDKLRVRINGDQARVIKDEQVRQR